MVLRNSSWYGAGVPPLTPVARRRDEVLDVLIDRFLAEGFAHLSVEDLARHASCSKTTLYQVAGSKEQIITTVVRHYFRRSTERIEARVAATTDPVERICVYLQAIADELRPAGRAFFADLAEFGPTHETYRHNYDVAARRVQELVTEASAPGGPDARFLGTLAGLAVESIQRGVVADATGLDDAAAFAELATVITATISRTPERTTA